MRGAPGRAPRDDEPVRTVLAGTSLAAAGATFLVAERVAARSWTAPRYSCSGRYVSDLGVPRRARFEGREIWSPRHAVMNAGFAVQGLLVTASGLTVPASRSLPGLRVMAGVYGLAMVGVGVFHGADSVSPTRHTLHGASGSLAVATAALAAMVTGRRTPAEPVVGLARLLSRSAGVVALTAGLAVPVAHGSPVVGVVQRSSLYAVTGWQLLTGACLVVRALRPPVTAPRADGAVALASNHG